MRKKVCSFGGEWRRIPWGGAVSSAIVLAVVWLTVLFIVGTPRGMLFFISTSVPTLPTWLFLLVMMFFFALCGFCMGAVLFGRGGGEVHKYRGAFYLSIALAAGYLWYAVMFGAALFLPAAFMAAVLLMGLVVAAVNFRRCLFIASVGLWLAAAWAFYLLFFSFFCFFLV